MEAKVDNKAMIIYARDFYLTNLWWIVLLALVALIGIVYLIDFLIVRKRKSLKEAPAKPSRGAYLSSLGGEANVLSHKLTGSRIVLTLVEYKKIDRDALKKTGITGFIEKSDQLTLVSRDAKEIYKLLFGEDVSA